QMRLAVQDGNGALANDAVAQPGGCFGLYKTGSPATSPPVALAAMSRDGLAVNGPGMQAFVGIEASRDSGPAASAPIGRWTISLESATPGSSMANVWLGRDDIPAGFPGEQDQLQFATSPPTAQCGTLSSLAGGHGVIVVGAYE